MSAEAGALRLKFAHAGGLKAKDGALRGFAIAGKDGNFVWANARIEGETVLLSNSDVPAPVAARYGWADNPIGNLVNGAALPAAPFRTDTPNNTALTPVNAPIAPAPVAAQGAEARAGQQEISPLQHVRPALPPIIVFHGSADKIVLETRKSRTHL